MVVLRTRDADIPLTILGAASVSKLEILLYMGPSHPPPALKERAFVWVLQKEHLPAVLVPEAAGLEPCLVIARNPSSP